MQKIGKYEVLQKLGAGGMGVVYKALDPLMERVVALKTMSEDLDAEPDLRERFFREARSAGALSHKNIVTIYDLGIEGKQAYIAMEFLDGVDLKVKLDKRERMSLEEVLRIVIDVCEGLSHAHRRGVVHRDIKPSNIHLTQQGQVKIMDFGLARIASSNITKTGIALGTPNYMSPEQARGDKVDHRADIFSVGAVAYELLTQKKPFDPRSTNDWRQVFFKVIFEEAEPVEKFNSALPPELTAVIQRAMAKDLAVRYPQIDDMIRDLDRVRRQVEERKSSLLQEARAAISRLDELVAENRALLREELEKGETGEETAVGPMRVGQGYFELWWMAEQARRDYDRFAALVAGRKKVPSGPPPGGEVEARLAEATACEKSGELEKALALGEGVLAQSPGHPQASSLVERTREELARQAREEARKRVLDGLLEKSQELYLRGELAGCLSSLDEALGMEPSLSGALTLRHRALSRMEEQKVDRQVEGLLREADFRFSRQDLVGCLALADEALKIKPRHAEAASLRQRASERLKELTEAEERRREVQAALAEARAALAAGDLERARERAAQAQASDPDLAGVAEIVSEIGRAAERRVLEERQRRLESLLGEARAQDAAGDEEAAITRVREALALEAAHVPALELLQAIEKRRAERERAESERREKLEEALSLARQAKAAGRLEEAIEAAHAALLVEPGHGETKRFLNEAQRQKKERERKISKLLKQARSLEKSGDEKAALARLEEIIALSADHAPARELLQAIEERRAERESAERGRREKVASLLSGAREARQAGLLEKAMGEARSALELDGAHAEARSFLEETRRQLKEREEKIAGLLEQARAAERAKDEAGALSALEELLALSPRHGQALELKQSIEEQQKRRERERRERIAADLEQARQAESRGDFERTLALAGALLKEKGEHGEARELIRRAEAAREMARVEAASRQILAEADRAARAGDPRAAAALLERAEPAVAASPQVRQARERHLKAAEALETAKKAEAEIEQGKQAFDRGDYARCEQSMERALALTRDSAEALRYLAQAREQMAEQREKEERAGKLGEALRLAEQAAGEGQLESAQREIGKALGLDPTHTVALELRAKIERQLEEVAEGAERQRRAQALAREAASFLKAGDAERALAALSEAESASAGLAGAAKLRKQAERALARRSGARSPVGRQGSAAAAAAGLVVVFFALRWILGGKQVETPSTTTSVAELTSTVAAEDSAVPPTTTLPPGLPRAAEAAQSRAARDASDAMARVQSEKESAARAGGASFPAFQEAGELEQAAAGHQRKKEYGSALAKLNQAIELYGRAQAEAVEQALKQADAAAQRRLAETARRDFERVRAEAAGAGAERWAAPSFREAASRAESALGKLNQRDFAGAAGDFQTAQQAMLRAHTEAQLAMRSAESALEAARRNLDSAKQSADSPQAAEEERRGRALAQEGKLIEAAEAFERAASLARAAAQATQAGAAERRAVIEAVRGYEAAMESKDLAALRSVWPSLGGGEGQLSQMFKMAKSVEVQLDCADPVVAGDRATVSCRRVIQITLANLDRPKPGESTNAFTLRKERGSWIIQEIK